VGADHFDLAADEGASVAVSFSEVLVVASAGAPA
jgi:hypothetical protein